MYYVFTTMSTVGFGDYNPRSDAERLACVLMFLGAGTVFALNLNEFSEIVTSHDELMAEIDEGDKLILFFDVLKHFNGDVDIGTEKRREYEEYFDFKWKNDRNSALNDDDEQALLDQLPVES